MYKLTFIVLMFFATNLWAINFFNQISNNNTTSPPPTVKNAYIVEINFTELQEGPDQLSFSLPNGDDITVNVSEFAPREGYQYFDEDIDPLGTPPFWIPDGTLPEELSYK